MEQFSLNKWLQDKSRKVVTRDGRPVRIICWDRNTTYWKIIALVTSPDGSTENPYTYDVNGNESDGCLHDHRNDLFFADEVFADEEKDIIRVFKSETDEEPETIVIPFGVKDSEFISGAYTIPKGCKARIEGNKVIIERIKREDELTEFEKEVAEAYEWAKTTEREDFVNEFAPKLLDLARKELQSEFEAELDKAYKCADKVQYENGKKDAMKSLPKWKKATENMDFDKHVLLFEDEERVVLTTELYKDEYYIELDDLKTLPKEE